MRSRLRTLEVVFESQQGFEREQEANISKGGIFIETAECFAVRERVQVRLVMSHGAGAPLVENLAGEVVHVVTPELAQAAKTGVAVHFEASPKQLEDLFAGWLEPAPKPIAPPSKAAGNSGGAADDDDDDERRASPRSRARVRARVCCPGREPVEGRTRNLSISGVLVSLEGDPAIPVGEPVEVFVVNPDEGTERLILGEVVRHIEDERGVRALGLRFVVPDSERPAVEEYIARLGATQHSRRLGGIRGAIEELGFVNLVQTFGISAREGTLEVIRGAQEGYLAFENGELLAAELGSARGVKALARMLSWVDGTFEFHARIDRDRPLSEPIALDAALIEAMRQMDESASVERSAFPLDAKPIFHAEACGGVDLCKLDQAIVDLAQAGMSVGRLLDVVPQTDDEIYVAMADLVERGILSV